jgi:hypothetical protein
MRTAIKKEGRNTALNLRLRKHIRGAIGSPVHYNTLWARRTAPVGGGGGTSRVALAEETTDGRLIGFCPDRKVSCGYLVKIACAACNLIGTGPRQKPTLAPQTNCLKPKHGRGCVEAGFFRGPPFRFSLPLTTQPSLFGRRSDRDLPRHSRAMDAVYLMFGERSFFYFIVKYFKHLAMHRCKGLPRKWAALPGTTADTAHSNL